MAALAARCITRVSAAATTIPFTCEVVPQDVRTADIILAHANVATTLVAIRTLEIVALVVPARHRRFSALGGLADGVPSALRAFGLAALAARCIACVSAASTTLPLAWEAVPVHVLAADVTLTHTGTAAALVSTSAFELGPVIIPAGHGRLATSGGFPRG